MPTTFVFIDTNVFVRILTQGQPGCEVEKWDELRSRASRHEITLLVPEVVILELSKKYRDLQVDLPARAKKLWQAMEDGTKKDRIWNELEGIFRKTEAYFSSKATEQLEHFTRYYSELDKHFQLSQGVEIISLDDAILREGRKRHMAGRIGRRNYQNQKGDESEGGSQESDCCIVETLVAYFKQRGSEDAQLLFCSENKADFAQEAKESQYILHPAVSEGLPPTKFVINLQEVLDLLNRGEVISRPDPKVLKEAAARERKGAIEAAQQDFHDLTGAVVGADYFKRKLAQLNQILTERIDDAVNSSETEFAHKCKLVTLMVDYYLDWFNKSLRLMSLTAPDWKIAFMIAFRSSVDQIGASLAKAAEADTSEKITTARLELGKQLSTLSNWPKIISSV